MKTLELKEFAVEMPDKNGGEPHRFVVTYKELITGALNYIPTNQFGQSVGVAPEDMRLRIRVLDKLDTDEKEILLDDKDVETIFNCVQNQKFIRVDKNLLDYHDYIRELHKSKSC